MFELTNKEVRIETTNICNAMCIMCPREKHTRKQGIMDMDFFRRLIDEVTDCGAERIFLGGYGEPLIDPKLAERVQYVKSKGLFCNFISNGSLWNEEITRKLIDAGLDEIRFSFYGVSDKTYQDVHVNLSFEETNRNIRNLCAVKKGNPQVLVFYLLLENNEHEVEKFKSEWINIADVIEIWRPHNWSNGRTFRGLDDNKRSCGRPQTGPLQVQWDGTVIPCCWDYNGEMILGDLNTQSVPEVFRSKKYDAIRNAHDEGMFSEFPFCDSCDQLHEHKDAIVYSSRHSKLEDAVEMTNSALFELR
ncbi:MAG: radical SAM protein [Nitrospinae bacterium]|nr:radical SAM protein [Nitrospinota bacterium]